MSLVENFNNYAISKLPTKRDDFSGTDDWSDVGSLGWGVNTTTDVIDWVGNVTTADGNNGTAFDLVTPVSDERWVLRFKLDVTSLVNGASSNSARVVVGLSDSNETVGTRTAQDQVWLEALTNSVNTNFVLVGANDQDFSLGTTATFSTASPTVGTYYCELKRTSKTELESTIYSDVSFTTVVERETITIPKTLRNLRYIRVASDSAGGTPDHTYNGTVDNIEFWDGGQQGDITTQDNFSLRTADISDDFSTDNWVETGTLNQVSGGSLSFNFDRDSTNHKTVRDLTTVSDTEWTLRWCQTNATVTQTGTPSTLGYVGMISTDNTTPANGTNDFIGLEYVVDNTNNIIRLIDSDGTALSSGTVRYTFSEVNAVNTRYWELKRLSATEIVVSVYSDASYTTLIETSGIQTTVSTVNTLRYIGVITDNQATSVSAHDGTIDDMEFYNGDSILSRWISENTAQYNVNTGTEKLEFSTPTGLVNTTAGTYDLGSALNDTNWIIRYKLDITNISFSGDQSTIYIGMSDTAGAGSANNQDFIGNVINVVSGQDTIRLQDNDGDRPDSVAQEGNIYNLNSIGIFYVELRRTSATTYESKLFTDANYTELLWDLGEVACVSTTDGLRYFQLEVDTRAGTTGNLAGSIDDLEIYDNVSVAKTPIFEQITFEDIFETDNWVDAHASSGVNTSTKVIDFTYSTDTQNESVAFDLGAGNVNDESWTLRWKFNFTTLTPLGNTVMWFGISDLSQSSSSASSTDALWIKPVHATGTKAWHFDNNDGTVPNTNTSTELDAEDVMTGIDYYCELKRLSSTRARATVYNDSDYTDVRFSKEFTIPSTTTGLRYIKLMNADLTNIGDMTGTVSQVRFWNGSLAKNHENEWREIDE